MRTRGKCAAIMIGAVALLWSLPAGGQQTGDLSRKDLDQRLAALLLDTMNLGASIFNAPNNNHEGCYLLYLGTLRTMRTVLDHRPDLQKVIDDRFAEAKGQKVPFDRAFTLRKAIDACYKGLAKAGAGEAGAPVAKKSLWDRLGGEGAVRAVVHDLIVAAAPDPKVNFDRGGAYKLTPDVVKDLEQKLVELVSAVGGGPLKYTGKDMKTAHQGMGITDAEFDALAGHLVATLNKYKVPAAEQKELVGIIAGTRGEIVEGKKDESKKEPENIGAGKKSLYERLGGEKAISAVVDDFVKRAANNPKVNFLRTGTPAAVKLDAAGVENLKKMLVDLIGSATGGPEKYAGRDMKSAHKGMLITDAEFDALAGDLKATLDHFNVPAAEQGELFAIIGSTRGDIVEEKKK